MYILDEIDAALDPSRASYSGHDSRDHNSTWSPLNGGLFTTFFSVRAFVMVLQ